MNYLVLLLVTLIAAGTPVFGRIALEHFPPIFLGFLRFTFATILLLVVLFGIKKQNLKFKKEHYRYLLFLGIICIPVNQIFFLGGLHFSAASHAGLIYGLSPIFVLVFSMVSKLEKVSRMKTAGFVLSFLGVAYLFVDSGVQLSSDFILGDFLLLFAVTTWAAYVTYSKAMVVEYGALKVNAGVFLIGSVCYFPIAVFDIPNFHPSGITYQSIIGFLYLAVITSFIGYFLWSYILKRMDTTKVAIMSNLAPILAVFFGVIFLNEPLTNGLIVGGCFTLAGIFMVQFSK